ncbi:hypothetical protein QQ045_023741 [Rhodiola kirilowii]
MGHNLGFQERWEFRRKEVNEDSSSNDDAKSNSEEALKNQRLVVDDDYHSVDHTQTEPEVGNQGTEGKSKCKKPRKKQQTRGMKRNKLVNEKIDTRAVKKARRTKRKGSAYDPGLMEDFKSFSESLLEDMKVTVQKMFVKMKEEMYELISNDPPCPKVYKGSNQVGYAQVPGQRNVRYDQMPRRKENFQELNGNEFTQNSMNQLQTRENANDVCDFPQVLRQKGLMRGRGLPNTSSNLPFVLSGLEGIATLASSGRVDSNGHHFIHQNSPSNFNLGLLPRNEESGQLCGWRTSSSSYGLEIAEAEPVTNFQTDAPFMKNGTRQLQTMLDGRVALHGNFNGDRMSQVVGDNSLVQTNLGLMTNKRAPSYMPRGMFMPPRNACLRNHPHFGN